VDATFRYFFAISDMLPFFWPENQMLADKKAKLSMSAPSAVLAA